MHVKYWGVISMCNAENCEWDGQDNYETNVHVWRTLISYNYACN